MNSRKDILEFCCSEQLLSVSRMGHFAKMLGKYRTDRKASVSSYVTHQEDQKSIFSCRGAFPTSEDWFQCNSEKELAFFRTPGFSIHPCVLQLDRSSLKVQHSLGNLRGFQQSRCAGQRAISAICGLGTPVQMCEESVLQEGALTSAGRLWERRRKLHSLQNCRPAAQAVVGGDSCVVVSPLAHLPKKPPTAELLMCSACFGAEALIARCRQIVSRATITHPSSTDLLLFTDDQIVPVTNCFLLLSTVQIPSKSVLHAAFFSTSSCLDLAGMG